MGQYGIGFIKQFWVSEFLNWVNDYRRILWVLGLRPYLGGVEQFGSDTLGCDFYRHLGPSENIRRIPKVGTTSTIPCFTIRFEICKGNFGASPAFGQTHVMCC